MSDFVAGDQVQLKSGGPVMTVERVDDSNVICIWFQGKSPNESVAKEKFPSVVLNKYEFGIG